MMGGELFARQPCFRLRPGAPLVFNRPDETQAWPASRLLHEYSSRGELAPDFRSAAKTDAGRTGSGFTGPALRDRAAAGGPGGARATGSRHPAGLPEMARTAGLLRFYDQRVSLRDVPRRPGEGTSLCAGLDDARAARLHGAAL